MVVWLITGYDILTGLFLVLDCLVAVHWASDKGSNVDWIMFGGYYTMVAPLIALSFFTVAYIAPRLLLMGRSRARRIVMKLHESLAWGLLWLTAVFVVVPTLLAAHHTGGVLMASTTLVHAILIGAAFAAAAYLRRA